MPGTDPFDNVLPSNTERSLENEHFLLFDYPDGFPAFRSWGDRPGILGPVAQWTKSAWFLPIRSGVRIPPGLPFFEVINMNRRSFFLGLVGAMVPTLSVAKFDSKIPEKEIDISDYDLYILTKETTGQDIETFCRECKKSKKFSWVHVPLELMEWNPEKRKWNIPYSDLLLVSVDYVTRDGDKFGGRTYRFKDLLRQDYISPDILW